MKKKIIVGSLIILLLGFLGFFYSVGYIPIIGNIIATEKINAYAQEVYKNEQAIDVGFDFYNMGNYNSSGYSYILNSNRLIDSKLYENAGKETPYKQDYQKIIQNFDDGISFEDYHISCTIDADDYSNKYYKLVVYKMSNDNILSNSESLIKPAEIVMQFIESMEIKYNFTSVNILYSDNNGDKQILVNGDIPISKEILIDNTKDIK